jgi:hypothetical protein
MRGSSLAAASDNKSELCQLGELLFYSYMCVRVRKGEYNGGSNHFTWRCASPPPPPALPPPPPLLLYCQMDIRLYVWLSDPIRDEPFMR